MRRLSNFKIVRTSRKKMIVSLSFLTILVSGCAESETNITSRIITAVEEKNFGAAEEIYEKEIENLSVDEKDNIDNAVSEALQEYTVKKYTQLENGEIKEDSFYYTLQSIKELGIDDEKLSEKIDSYVQKKDTLKEKDSNNVAINVLESIKERDYETARQIYQNALIGASEETVNKTDQAVSDAIQEYIDGRFAELGTGTDTEAAILGMVSSIKETQIGGNVLAGVINTYSQVEEKEEISEVVTKAEPVQAVEEQARVAAEEKAKQEAGTMSQQQAVKKAEDYIDHTAFSRSGLIEQLVFEGFSNSDASYAVGKISVDWKEQAIKKAEDYIDHTAFSRSGLIEQLVFEGFSNSDASYAVGKISVDWKEQAVKKAEDYIDHTAFSRSGLIEQLVFEGFSNGDATYAANQVGL